MHHGRALVPVALIAAAAPAAAADHRYVVTEFDRIRVEGPFDVRVTTRGTPMARAAGSSDALDVHVEGTTLIVRAARGGETAPAAPILYLRTTTLRSATVIGGGKLDIAGPLRSQRVDLQVTGSGALAVAALDAEQVVATLLGNGAMTLGGRAGRVRLLSNGAGAIEAGALLADDLVVRIDGAGTTRASARYFANVATTGFGAVTVYGKPKCTVKASADGPVACGGVLPVR